MHYARGYVLALLVRYGNINLHPIVIDTVIEGWNNARSRIRLRKYREKEYDSSWRNGLIQSGRPHLAGCGWRAPPRSPRGPGTRGGPVGGGMRRPGLQEARGGSLRGAMGPLLRAGPLPSPPGPPSPQKAAPPKIDETSTHSQRHSDEQTTTYRRKTNDISTTNQRSITD